MEYNDKIFGGKNMSRDNPSFIFSHKASSFIPNYLCFYGIPD